MTRQHQVQKWGIYGLALGLVFLIDVALLSQFPISGVCPVLIPLAVAAVAVMEGGIAGAPVGFVMGLLWVGGYGGGHGMRIFFLTLVGLFVGSAAQYMFSQSFWGYLLCASATTASLTLWQVGIRLFLRTAPLSYLLPIATTEFLYSICFAPPIYLLFRKVYRRVGGTKLA